MWGSLSSEPSSRGQPGQHRDLRLRAPEQRIGFCCLTPGWGCLLLPLQGANTLSHVAEPCRVARLLTYYQNLVSLLLGLCTAPCYLQDQLHHKTSPIGSCSAHLSGLLPPLPSPGNSYSLFKTQSKCPLLGKGFRSLSGVREPVFSSSVLERTLK